jgi:hypothetical protein
MKHLPDNFRPRKRRAGFLLPLVAVYILVAFILSFGILMVGSGDQSAAFRRLRREQAFYLAEAGLQRALAEISRDGLDNVSWPMAGALAPGGFTVPEPAEEDGIFTLFATGTAGNITETVSLSFSPGADADAGGPGIFAQGCFGRSRVVLTGSSRIEAYDSSGQESDPAASVAATRR